MYYELDLGKQSVGVISTLSLIGFLKRMFHWLRELGCVANTSCVSVQSLGGLGFTGWPMIYKATFSLISTFFTHHTQMNLLLSSGRRHH